MKKRLMIILILIIFISGCDRGINQPYKWRFPLDIPKADITFNTIRFEKEGDVVGKDVLGFYSFQDQSVKILELPNESSPIQPYYLNSESIFFIDKMGNLGSVNEGQAYLSIFSKYQYLDCDELIGYAYPNNGNIIFLGQDVKVVNEYDCSTVRTILTKEDLISFGEEYHIGIRALAEDESFIVFEVADELIKVTLPQKEVFDYRRKGAIPSISPDQKKIAYIASDGIHIMDTTGENDFLAVPYRVSSYDEDFDIWERGTPPRPNWSKDSSKIVYHKCILPVKYGCHNINNYNIFVYDLKTKKETMIIASGLNPSWNYYKQNTFEYILD